MKFQSHHPSVASWSRMAHLSRSKIVVAACLLASTALFVEPRMAEARNGMNAFVAGAILGGAMRGTTPRAYRGSRTGRRVARQNRSRSKDKDDVKDPSLDKAAARPELAPAASADAAGTAGAAGAGATAAAGAAGAAGAAAATGSAAAAPDGATGNTRGSRRNGRRGPGGLETVKSGLD